MSGKEGAWLLLGPDQPVASVGILGVGAIGNGKEEIKKQWKAPTERSWRVLMLFGLSISLLPSPLSQIARRPRRRCLALRKMRGRDDRARSGSGLDD